VTLGNRALQFAINKKEITMADYKEMYKRLFQSQTKAIDILIKAQQDTEEMYISAPETNVKVLRPEEDE